MRRKKRGGKMAVIFLKGRGGHRLKEKNRFTPSFGKKKGGGACESEKRGECTRETMAKDAMHK